MATRLAPTDADLPALDPELLAQLLARRTTPAEPPSEQPKLRRAPRKPSGTYEAVLGKVALLIALGVIAFGWWAGGTFTLAALAAWGAPIAAWGLLAWGIPLVVTLLEIGTFMARSHLSWLWSIWCAVLAIDIYTTAAGLLVLVEGRAAAGYVFSGTDPVSWIAPIILGIILALAPEPAGRALWNELWK
jgi:hypothetical protein